MSGLHAQRMLLPLDMAHLSPKKRGDLSSESRVPAWSENDTFSAKSAPGTPAAASWIATWTFSQPVGRERERLGHVAGEHRCVHPNAQHLLRCPCRCFALARLCHRRQQFAYDHALQPGKQAVPSPVVAHSHCTLKKLAGSLAAEGGAPSTGLANK